MVNLYKQDGETLYGIKEYILDSPEDVGKLPKDIKAGSTALVITSGDIYILNGRKEWVLLGTESGQGGGSEPSNSSNLDVNQNNAADQVDLYTY